MTRRLRCAPFLTAIAIAIAPAAGGEQSDWVVIPKPAEMTVAPNARGTTAMFQTTGEVHLFSGITKQWTTIVAPAVDFAEQYHSHAIVHAGAKLHGYSSRTGLIDTVSVSDGVSLVNGPIHDCFVTLAVDGSTVFAFSGLRGEWRSLSVSQRDPQVVATGTIGLIRDGATIHAFSAHHGEFVPVSADPAAELAIATETATAHSAGHFRAYSAQRNVWRTAAFPTTGVTILRSGFALAIDGPNALAFSGLCGELAAYSAASPITTVQADAAVATFIDGGDAIAYGAGRGAFAVLPGGASAVPLLDGDFALFEFSAGVTPFSAVTGAFGLTLHGAFTLATNESIAFADGDPLDFAYSPIRNQWIASRAVAAGPPLLLRSVVVVPTVSGYQALSARSDAWVPCTVSTPFVFSASLDGATFVAHDGPSVAHVFDARIGRFETIAGAAPLATKVFRNTFVAHDGSTIWGFGQNAGRLQSLPLASPVSSVLAKTSIAIVETTNELLVFSAKGSLSQEGRYPEYYLSVQLGNVLRLHQAAPPGAALLMLIGTKPAHLPLSAEQGVLFLDPAFVVATIPLGVVPASGLAEFALPLPDSPALVGLQPQLQNIVWPPSGTAYLTSSVSPILY